MRFHVVALLACLAPLPCAAQAADEDARAIRRVIEDAYVNGVFVARDAAAVRAGFHPDFVLTVNEDGGLLTVSLAEWLDHLQLDGRPTDQTVRHEFDRVDVAGGTASVTLRLWIDGEHVYTDHMGLYRFADGWKIVTKIFESHT